MFVADRSRLYVPANKYSQYIHSRLPCSYVSRVAFKDRRDRQWQGKMGGYDLFGGDFDRHQCLRLEGVRSGLVCGVRPAALQQRSVDPTRLGRRLALL